MCKLFIVWSKFEQSNLSKENSNFCYESRGHSLEVKSLGVTSLGVTRLGFIGLGVIGLGVILGEHKI